MHFAIFPELFKSGDPKCRDHTIFILRIYQTVFQSNSFLLINRFMRCFNFSIADIESTLELNCY